MKGTVIQDALEAGDLGIDWDNVVDLKVRGVIA